MLFPGSLLSPLDEARQSLGLSLDDLATALRCSESAVSRYLSGRRTPPPDLFALLGAGDLRVRHEEWLARAGRKRTRGATTIHLTTRLPRGVTAEAATKRCAEVLAELATEVVQP